jgi:hypothetical protein
MIEPFEKEITVKVSAKRILVSFDQLYFRALRHFSLVGQESVDLNEANCILGKIYELHSLQRDYYFFQESIALGDATIKEAAVLENRLREFINSPENLEWFPDEIKEYCNSEIPNNTHNVLVITHFRPEQKDDKQIQQNFSFPVSNWASKKS